MKPPKLCIALDNPSLESNLALLTSLRPLSPAKQAQIWLKVGLRSFIRDGVRGLDSIRACGDYKLFLDLKLYDIPNTMLDSITECARLGVDMLTIHASCGFEAMRAIARLKESHAQFPLIIAVTALTSFDNEGFEMIYNAPLFPHALRLATLSYQAGIDGIVCSVNECAAIKARTQEGFLAITPGIRPFGESSGDQKRVATLEDSKRAGSDFVVIGRPIYEAHEPLDIVGKILNTLQGE